VVLWQDGLDAVTSADPATGRALADALHEWHGAHISRQDDVRVDERASGFAIARRELQSLLARRAREAGVRITYAAEVDPDDLPAADLIVAADGVGSRLRRARSADFGTQTVPSRNRYVWLGATTYLDSFTFAFLHTDAGWLWCHGYGYGEGRSTFIVECPVETWERLGFGSSTTADTLGLLERLFADHLRGARLLAPPDAGDQMQWLTFATLTNRTWHRDNVVLLGDAAHTTHFSIGSGTKLALEDAAGLVDALEAQPELSVALATFEARRRPEVEQAQRHAVHSLEWFENFSRYSDLAMPDFTDLLERRRSSLLGRIPPKVYLRLRRLADRRSKVNRSLQQLRAR
jgi:2-polyprenyl-6-methoxyphenol hydroxylase-like FAD-dependent oxidoreductase